MKKDLSPLPVPATNDFCRDEGRKLLGGVVAGLQRRYLPQTDLTVLRVLTVVISLMSGAAPFAALAYALLWVLAPAV